MIVMLAILGGLTVISALGVVLARSPLSSALCLVTTIFFLAIHYALLDAHLIAVLQLLIYAGAIMVLVVFVVMLLGLGEIDPLLKTHSGFFSRQSWKALVVFSCLGLFFIIGLVFARTPMISNLAEGGEQSLDPAFGTTAEIGKLMLTTHLYPFELVSVLLLAAIVGSVFLAAEAKRSLPPGRGLQAMQNKSPESQESEGER